MTLSKMYVPCVDGKYYADPAWYGKDYTISIDEDGGEIWIRPHANRSPFIILNKLGIKFANLKQEAFNSSRAFYNFEKKNYEFKSAITYKFTPTDKIPKPDRPRQGKDTLKNAMQWYDFS
jgi:hypothetical protein